MTGINKALTPIYCFWTVFGFAGKRECFRSDAGSCRKPVEGMQQWLNVTQLHPGSAAGVR